MLRKLWIYKLNRNSLVNILNKSTVQISIYKYSSQSNAFNFNSDIKLDLLNKSLNYVSEFGWSDDAIINAAKDMNLPPVTLAGIIECGSKTLIEHFLTLKRNHVRNVMTTNDNNPAESHESSNIHQYDDDIIYKSILLHLDFIKPFQKSWPSAIAHLLDPRYCDINTVSLLTDVIDDICEFSNIRTSRLDWYSERGFLLLVYTATELYMLSDDSVDLCDTK